MEKKKITLETIAKSLKGMATKADIKGMATKADIKGMASKADLSGMATKVYLAKVLENMATKADLSGMATKVDLAKVLENMATKADLVKVTKSISDLSEIVDNLAISTKKGFDNTVSKKEFTEFKDEMIEFKEEMTDFKKRTDTTLFNMDNHARETNIRLDKIEKTLPSIVSMSETMENEIRSLNLRFEDEVVVKNK